MSVIRKILVVDDDPVVGKSFDRVLSSRGYAVITAADGEEALLKLDKEHYDVVFTDIKMPGISGLEVAERVKARQPWLPVVIVTGYGTGANQERAEAAGVSGFLRKPLSPEMIEASTEKALRSLVVAVAPAVAGLPVAAEEMPAIELAASKTETITNFVLFLAAPFIGLAYVLTMPLVALGTVIGLAARAIAKAFPISKDLALFFAAPMIGLAYVVAMPLVEIGVLAWFGSKALLKRN